MDSNSLNALAETLRRISRYLDEVSYLPELEDPFSVHIDSGPDDRPRVTVYLAATRTEEAAAVNRLCVLAAQLGGVFEVSEPIDNRPGSFRSLSVLVEIPAGGLLRVWSPIAYVEPAPVKAVALTA